MLIAQGRGFTEPFIYLLFLVCFCHRAASNELLAVINVESEESSVLTGIASSRRALERHGDVVIGPRLSKGGVNLYYSNKRVPYGFFKLGSHTCVCVCVYTQVLISKHK